MPSGDFPELGSDADCELLPLKDTADSRASFGADQDEPRGNTSFDAEGWVAVVILACSGVAVAKGPRPWFSMVRCAERGGFSPIP